MIGLECSIRLKKLYSKAMCVPKGEWSEDTARTLRGELVKEVERAGWEMIARSNRGGWARVVNISEPKEGGDSLVRGWSVFLYTGVVRCLDARRVSGVMKHKGVREGDIIHVK